MRLNNMKNEHFEKLLNTTQLLNSQHDLFTVEEVAGALRVTEATIRRLIKTGELKGYKFGGSIRITKQSFTEMLGQAAKDFRKLPIRGEKND